MNDLMASLKAVRKARSDIKVLLADASDAGLQAMGHTAIQNLTDWEQSVTQVKFRVFEDEDSWPSLFDAQIRHLIDALGAGGPHVSNGATKRYDDLKKEWDDHKQTVAALMAEVETLNAKAADLGLTVIRPVKQ